MVFGKAVRFGNGPHQFLPWSSSITREQAGETTDAALLFFSRYVTRDRLLGNKMVAGEVAQPGAGDLASQVNGSLVRPVSALGQQRPQGVTSSIHSLFAVFALGFVTWVVCRRIGKRLDAYLAANSDVYVVLRSAALSVASQASLLSQLWSRVFPPSGTTVVESTSGDDKGLGNAFAERVLVQRRKRNKSDDLEQGEGEGLAKSSRLLPSALSDSLAVMFGDGGGSGGGSNDGHRRSGTVGTIGGRRREGVQEVEVEVEMTAIPATPPALFAAGGETLAVGTVLGGDFASGCGDSAGNFPNEIELKDNALYSLAASLPARLRGRDLELIFSSGDDGFNLRTLQRRAGEAASRAVRSKHVRIKRKGCGGTSSSKEKESHLCASCCSDSILVILTDEGAVLGAYCGAGWGDPDALLSIADKFRGKRFGSSRSISSRSTSSDDVLLSSLSSSLSSPVPVPSDGFPFFGSPGFLFSLRPAFRVHAWTGKNE